MIRVPAGSLWVFDKRENTVEILPFMLVESQGSGPSEQRNERRYERLLRTVSGGARDTERGRTLGRGCRLLDVAFRQTRAVVVTLGRFDAVDSRLARRVDGAALLVAGDGLAG